MKLIIKHKFNEHIITTQDTMNSIARQIEIATKICIKSLNDNGKILNMSNRGSSDDTPRIQEMRIFIGHVICHLIELEFSKSK